MDPLTGVFKRLSLAERFADLAGPGAPARPLGLVLCDVDGFAAVNRAHGHPVGDRVLRELAAVLREHSAATDLVFCLGGERFAALLPGVDREGADRVAGAVRAAVADAPFAGLEITTSVGAAALPAVSATWEGLHRAAESALRSARQAPAAGAAASPAPGDGGGR